MESRNCEEYNKSPKKPNSWSSASSWLKSLKTVFSLRKRSKFNLTYLK